MDGYPPGGFETSGRVFRRDTPAVRQKWDVGRIIFCSTRTNGVGANSNAVTFMIIMRCSMEQLTYMSLRGARRVTWLISGKLRFP
jgi:hypothetical protein